ncbi:hypothetical protein [Streptomyces sp. NPDC051211]|uniref:hypothetical protein n=1 Tax=Streptomyces sp. NPDC051211 TaxID=3154643 RepID=UPI00344C1EEB
MSFGDPNNPYGQQPQGGQPQYGYPQAPQGIPPQAGYGYPQQAMPAYPAGPGAGYPAGMPVSMPGGVVAARVILFIQGGLTALFGVLIAVGGGIFAAALSDSGSSSAEDAGAIAGGVAVIGGLILVALSLWPILTAAKMSKGRAGVRVSGIVFGSLQALFAGIGLLINLIALSDPHALVGSIVFSMILTLINLALSIWIIAGLANSAAGAYFRRP